MNRFMPCHNLARSLQHNGENFPDFAKPAAGEKPDQIQLAFFARSKFREILDHRMPDENRPQAGFIVELRFEGKDAEHQIQKARHLADSSPIPSPNLGTDVINYFERLRFPSKRASKAQIKSGVINQNHRVGINARNLAERALELLPEISIPFDDFPKPNHGGGVAPVYESYDDKWEYVRNNPVRHGYATKADDWPYQGELNELRW